MHPKYIFSDNESGILGEFRDELLRNGVILDCDFPYSPWMNGSAELSVRKFKNTLSKAIADSLSPGTSTQEWPEILPDLINTINKSPKCIGKFSREAIMFGQTTDNFPAMNYVNNENFSLEELTERHINTAKIINENQKEARNKQIDQYTKLAIATPKQRSTRDFHPGQLVLLHRTSKEDALSAPKIGPFRVVKNFPRGAQIQDCKSGILRSASHDRISHLKTTDLDYLLPENFCEEISKLARDLNKRHHATKGRLVPKHRDKIIETNEDLLEEDTNDLSSPSNELDDNDDETENKDLEGNTQNTQEIDITPEGSDTEDEEIITETEIDKILTDPFQPTTKICDVSEQNIIPDLDDYEDYDGDPRPLTRARRRKQQINQAGP